jgi:hypothetical protein
MISSYHRGFPLFLSFGVCLGVCLPPFFKKSIATMSSSDTPSAPKRLLGLGRARSVIPITLEGSIRHLRAVLTLQLLLSHWPGNILTSRLMKLTVCKPREL